MNLFKDNDNYITPIVVLLLIWFLVRSVFWFFDKNPLSDNIDIKNSTTEITFSVSESYEVKVDENRTHWETDTVTLKADLAEKSVQDIIKVMDEISSRSRKAGIGSVTIHSPSINTVVGISYMVDDKYIDLVMTNEQNIMYNMADSSCYTLNKGDLDKIAAAIKQYATNK